MKSNWYKIGFLISVAVILFGAVMSTVDVTIPDVTRDAFSRLRVSNGFAKLDAQFTYDLQPLLFDTITTDSVSGGVEYDATNRCAKISVTGADSAVTAAMQSFKYIRYIPANSQIIFVTFNMHGGDTMTQKFAGYSDGTNGIEFFLDGKRPAFRILSGSGNGDQVAYQEDWNIDQMNGAGRSGKGLDITKTQILVIQFQALYVGKVSVGFDIDGEIVMCHTFEHANIATFPYIQTANLPVRVGMTTIDSGATDSLRFICASVITEGGIEENYAFEFTQNASATAGNGSEVHVISIEPRQTFAGIENRTTFELDKIEVFNEGANDVIFRVFVGREFTGATVDSVNTSFSAFQYWTGGSLSASADSIQIDGTFAAGGQGNIAGESKGTEVAMKYPITLDHEGLNRPLGRINITAEGIGGTSAVEVAVKWREIR